MYTHTHMLLSILNWFKHIVVIMQQCISEDGREWLPRGPPALCGRPAPGAAPRRLCLPCYYNIIGYYVII